MRSPTLPRCTQLIKASHLIIVATSHELRRHRPPPPPSISSSSRSTLAPLLAQLHSAVPHSSRQRLPSHAPYITIKKFPILGPPFTAGSAQSTETPPHPSSSAAPHHCQVSPTAEPGRHLLRKHRLDPSVLYNPRASFPNIVSMPLSSRLLCRAALNHHHESTTKTAGPVHSSSFPIGRNRGCGQASHVSFQFHFLPKSLSCTAVVL
jgi:hypothetical protein